MRRGIVQFRPHQTIMRPEDPPSIVYTIYEGWAYSGIVLGDGRRQIVSFMIPGDSIGLLSLYGKSPIGTVRALTPTTLCMFDANDMKSQLIATDQGREALERATIACATEIAHRLTDVGQRRASGRVAALLLALEARLRKRGYSERGAFEFPPNQEHLADALGLTPAHVNRTLMQFRKLGLLEHSKGRMHILDFSQLQRIARED